MIYDIAIIGAGASGLMCASMLNNSKQKVVLLESSSSCANKIMISGGAKCNITNRYMDISKFLCDEHFVQKSLYKFDHKDMLNFLKENQIYPMLNEKIVKGSYFCKNSKQVVDMFLRLTTNIKKELNFKVLDITYKDNIFDIVSKNHTIKAVKVVVASGGKSFETLGSSDIAYDIAKKFGHKIITTAPALVGWTVQKEQFWFKSLSGLSLDVKIKINNKTIYGSMLFTHKGCSGPAVLNASLYWTKGFVTIDFAPNQNSHLPRRFRQIAKKEGIDLKNYTFAPAGNFGYTKAEITKGGVDTNQIDEETFQSKLQKNLFFIGELLDVSGQLGGYNLQWAINNGFICGKFLKN